MKNHPQSLNLHKKPIMKLINRFLLFSAVIILFSLNNVNANPPKLSKTAKQFVSWFEGDYTNKGQAKRDTTIAEQEIHIVKIWNKLVTDGIWFYEEIVDMKSGKPVSQKFYQLLESGEGRFDLEVFTYNKMEDYKDAYTDDEPFADLSPDDLEAMPDCIIGFSKAGETRFAGSTTGKTCTVNRANASYVTLEMNVFEARIMRKEKGFNFQDTQVFGPYTTQGIIYTRIVKK